MDIDTARRGRVRRPRPVVTAVAMLLIFDAVWAFAGTNLVVSTWSWWTADIYDRMYGEIIWNLGIALLAIALLSFALTVAVIHGRRRARDALVALTMILVVLAGYMTWSLVGGWTVPVAVFLSSPLLGLVAVGLLYLPASQPFFDGRRART